MIAINTHMRRALLAVLPMIIFPDGSKIDPESARQ